MAFSYDDIEVWKAIPNFDGYEVSSYGRVRSYLIKSLGKDPNVAGCFLKV